MYNPRPTNDAVKKAFGDSTIIYKSEIFFDLNCSSIQHSIASLLFYNYNNFFWVGSSPKPYVKYRYSLTKGLKITFNSLFLRVISGSLRHLDIANKKKQINPLL